MSAVRPRRLRSAGRCPAPPVALAVVILAFAAVPGAGAQTREASASRRIVAAENFYGDVARQLAGPGWTVTGILSNPSEDPHLFEASPSVARDVARARIVIVNGAGYDPWMDTLLSASPSATRQTVEAAALTGHHPGDNPHLWYDPSTMRVVARAIAADLVADDPPRGAVYRANLDRFLQALEPVDRRIAVLRAQYEGLPVTATEPVFGPMVAALGLVMRNQRFQLAVMNEAEPAASDVAAMEGDLRGHMVRLLIYNPQATDTAAERLLEVARQAGIPILGVTETEPRNAASFQGWILGQLDALDRALSHPPA